MDTAHTFAPSAARDDSGVVMALPPGPRELTKLDFDSLMFAYRVKNKRAAEALGVSVRRVRQMRNVVGHGWATKDPAVVEAIGAFVVQRALTWADVARGYLFGGADPMPAAGAVQDAADIHPTADRRAQALAA